MKKANIFFWRRKKCEWTSNGRAWRWSWWKHSFLLKWSLDPVYHVEVVIGAIWNEAASHALFSRIRQVAPMCSPFNTLLLCAHAPWPIYGVTVFPIQTLLISIGSAILQGSSVCPTTSQQLRLTKSTALVLSWILTSYRAARRYALPP